MPETDAYWLPSDSLIPGERIAKRRTTYSSPRRTRCTFLARVSDTDASKFRVASVKAQPLSCDPPALSEQISRAALSASSSGITRRSAAVSSLTVNGKGRR